MHPIFGMEHSEDFYPCKILGFFSKFPDMVKEPMVLLHACSGLMLSGKQNTCLTKMWQLSYGKPKTINSPVEMDGTRKWDNQGNEISRIRVCKPSLYLESVDSLGHHSFVIEEYPGIHQNVEHKSREAVGWVL